MTGPWKHPPRRPDRKAPGAGLGLAIIITVGFWAVMAAALLAARVF